MIDSQLFTYYQQLWSNRTIPFDEGEEALALVKAIESELLDEATHPRVRKTPWEKYCRAYNRVLKSDLPNKAQVFLVFKYEDVYLELKKRNWKPHEQ
ncbi:hypothetical protein [Bacillus sp. 2205SS5-2]|uniref:hypothetical protein n=1 Tax=Bacillus sp. 2205SS5-2 TaxID=3109031 RepID=UPI00300738E7